MLGEYILAQVLQGKKNYQLPIRYNAKTERRFSRMNQQRLTTVAKMVLYRQGKEEMHIKTYQSLFCIEHPSCKPIRRFKVSTQFQL